MISCISGTLRGFAGLGEFGQFQGKSKVVQKDCFLKGIKILPGTQEEVSVSFNTMGKHLSFDVGSVKQIIAQQITTVVFICPVLIRNRTALKDYNIPS